MKKFSDICGGHYFMIPANQRGFSWKKENVDDVFRDLELAGSNAHYMGPIIVSRTDTQDFQDDNLDTTAEFRLEDGQQRITTFFLLANEIRKRIEELNGEPTLESKDLERLIFYKQGTLVPRLQNANESLQSCLEHFLLGNPAPANTTPPMNAMRVVGEQLKLRLAQMDEEQLLIWKNRMSNQAKFIWVDLASEGINSYLAFDAINSRGVPLSEFDKIKNFCILVAETRILDASPAEAWYAAITQLEKFDVAGRSDEEAFVAELYGTFHDDRVSQRDVHASFVKRYRPLLERPDPALENDFKSFIDLWESYARSFGFIATRNRSQHYPQMCSQEAAKWLDRLDNMELPTIARPLLTACHLRMPHPDFEKIVCAAEKCTFRIHAVMGHRKDKNSKAIYKLAEEVLRLNKDSAYCIKQICEWLEKLAPLDRVIEVLANGEAKYNHDPRVKGWTYCYYFLYEYELSVSPAGVAPLPWAADKRTKVNSQEHILPQTHRDGAFWQESWEDEAKAEKFKHRLGNLVLTAGNSILGRKSIKLKLDDPDASYTYSGQKATNGEKRITNFTDGSSWKSCNILCRELELLEFAAERWSIPCCVDNAVINLPDEFSDAPVNAEPIVIESDDCYEEEDDDAENGGLDPDEDESGE